MEDLSGASMVREVEGAHVDAGKQPSQGRDPRVVRAVRVTDEERRVVEPDRVAALGVLALRERTRDRQAGRLEVGPQRFRLAVAVALSPASGGSRARPAR